MTWQRVEDLDHPNRRGHDHVECQTNPRLFLSGNGDTLCRSCTMQHVWQSVLTQYRFIASSHLRPGGGGPILGREGCDEMAAAPLPRPTEKWQTTPEFLLTTL